MNEDLQHKELARRLLSMIEHALASGLSLPLYVVLVSVYGQVTALRYDRGHPGPGSGERTPGWNGIDLHSMRLCEYIPDDIPALWDKLPINVFFSDSAGKATRAVLEADGQPKWTN
jgi:hypothetical protein